MEPAAAAIAEAAAAVATAAARTAACEVRWENVGRVLEAVEGPVAALIRMPTGGVELESAKGVDAGPPALELEAQVRLETMIVDCHAEVLSSLDLYWQQTRQVAPI